MISRDEALALAREWADERGSTFDVTLFEFDLGYVACLVEPVAAATDGPPLPPPATGYPRAVIDRESGEVSQWPSLPWQTIAERYAQRRAAEGRFPPDVRYVLEQAGWFPGRDFSAAVDHWMVRFADELAGLECPPVVRAALVEFGGLHLPQFGNDGDLGGGFTSYVHPTEGGVVTEAARAFAEEFENPVYPIGNNEDGPSELVADAQGRVFMLHWADDFFVGPDIDSAIVNLIRGNEMSEASDRDW
ncbi:SUKH-3 domain-containing protein [Micromonospora sp. C51]|uniref:SUKH-3 domain-containing protein n=1 Tax=Micromonospora sp. C51 TaxID=2824879 RepID=UPI001B39BF7D|nr:SUKH-3 domain-containing protein [Micromonospora sp. C51]MBQ1050658.1 SUKH-3 domain-containing protein [Micromonospora sp. C51]